MRPQRRRDADDARSRTEGYGNDNSADSKRRPDSPRTQQRAVAECFADEIDADYDAHVDASESYQGTWTDGMRDGVGTQKYCERRGGGQYEGTWQNDTPSGRGKRDYDYMSMAMVVSKTRRETGNARKYGQGNNGDVVVPVGYEGGWQEGVWMGEGTVTFSDGVTIKSRSWNGNAIAAGPAAAVDLHAQALTVPVESGRRCPGLYAGMVRLESPTGGPGLRTRRGGYSVAVASAVGIVQRHGRGKHVFAAIGDRTAELQAKKKAMGPKGPGLYGLVGKGDVYDGNWFADVRHGVGQVSFCLNLPPFRPSVPQIFRCLLHEEISHQFLCSRSTSTLLNITFHRWTGAMGRATWASGATGS